MKAQLLFIFCLSILSSLPLISQEEIVKEGEFEKKLAYNYENLTGQSTYYLREIQKRISPDNYNSVDYQIGTKWKYSLGKVFNRPAQTRLTLALEDLAYFNLPAYKGFELNEPFVPESIFLTITVNSPDTSFTSTIEIDNLTKKTRQFLAIPATNTTAIEFKEIALKYTQKNVNLAKSKVNQIDDLLKTKAYLEQVYSQNKVLKIASNDPDSILANNAKFEQLMSTLEKDTNIKSLRNKLDKQLLLQQESFHKKVENIHENYVARGNQRLAEKDYQKAIEDVEKALKNNAGYLSAFALRASIAWEMEGLAESLVFFEEGSKHFSKSPPKDTFNFINLGLAIKAHYLQLGNDSLKMLAYESAIALYNKVDTFCTTYTMVNCQDFDLNQKIRLVRQTQYNHQLDSIATQIDLLQFEVALAAIKRANTFFDKHQLRNIGKYQELRKQATRGRWNELVTKANEAEKLAMNTNSNDYKQKLLLFEAAAANIAIANEFRLANKVLLPGSYVYALDDLNKSRYDFHFEYAEKYAFKNERKASLEEFKAAKAFLETETEIFTNAYGQVFQSEHQHLVSLVNEESEQAALAEKAEAFEKSRSSLEKAAKKNEAVLELEKSWLSETPMSIQITAKDLSQKIKQQRLKMGKLAIWHYSRNNEFKVAKEFDQYRVENGGVSDLRKIEKDELFFLKGVGTEAMAQNDYEKGVATFETAIKLYENSLSTLEENQQALNDWVDKYGLSIEGDLKKLFDNYYEAIGVVVIAEDQSFRKKLTKATAEKDYISAYQTVVNKNHLLEHYDGKYEIDYTQIKQDIPIIKTCSDFQDGCHNSLKNIDTNSYKAISHLYDLQSQYQQNIEISKRIDQPSFIPLAEFLKSQSASVIYYGADVFSEKKEVETAYQLLLLSLEKGYPHENMEHVQQVIGKQLAELDKKNKKYKNKRKGWQDRIPDALKKLVS